MLISESHTKMTSISIFVALFIILCISVNASITCSSNADCAGDNVLCTSDYSCQRANSLTGKYEVKCGGHYSCQGVDDIKATDSTYGKVECGGEYSCAKANIDAAQNVYCKAERSCKRSTITAGGNVYLQDQYSVQGATVTADGSILISSKEGAARAQSLTAGEDVYINGIFGAATTKITAGEKVTCIGQSSCFNTRRITTSTNTLSVTYNGDAAGQLSNVFCPKSGTCTINCINGCVSNTVIYYTRNSGLTISPSECDPTSANRPTDTCPSLQVRHILCIHNLLR